MKEFESEESVIMFTPGTSDNNKLVNMEKYPGDIMELMKSSSNLTGEGLKKN